MKVSLVMIKADGSRRDFPLRSSRTIIGRQSTCDLRIPLSAISRNHCELRIKDGQVRIRDLGSSNGTLRNGKPIKEASLKAGDRVQVGPVIFTVIINGRPEDVDPSSTLIAQAQGLDQPEQASPTPARASVLDEEDDLAAAAPADDDNLDGLDQLDDLLPDEPTTPKAAETPQAQAKSEPAPAAVTPPAGGDASGGTLMAELVDEEEDEQADKDAAAGVNQKLKALEDRAAASERRDGPTGAETEDEEDPLAALQALAGLDGSSGELAPLALDEDEDEEKDAADALAIEDDELAPASAPAPAALPATSGNPGAAQDTYDLATDADSSRQGSSSALDLVSDEPVGSLDDSEASAAAVAGAGDTAAGDSGLPLALDESDAGAEVEPLANRDAEEEIEVEPEVEGDIEDDDPLAALAALNSDDGDDDDPISALEAMAGELQGEEDDPIVFDDEDLGGKNR